MTGGGSYSRYFDLDKWYERSNNENTNPIQDANTKSSSSTLPFLIVPKASKSEKNKGLTNLPQERKLWKGSEGHKGVGDYKPDGSARANTKHQNHHPTVKPLKLMSYLITLFSREGDIVLDPFVGSGTTCLAAKKLNRKYIGIEREAEYIEIAKARLIDNQVSLV